MKYKKGDEVLAKAIIEAVDGLGKYRLVFNKTVLGAAWVCEDKIISTADKPESIRWRDGAGAIQKHITVVYIEKTTNAIGLIESSRIKNDETWSYYYWLPADEFPMPLQPEPIRWRDGAVDLPKCNQNVYCTPKNNFRENIFHVCDVSPEQKCWESVYWLPADEFTVLLPPEPVDPEIEPCPFCGQPCDVTKLKIVGTGAYIQCTTDECYNGPLMPTVAEAIEVHNKVFGKLTHDAQYRREKATIQLLGGDKFPSNQQRKRG